MYKLKLISANFRAGTPAFTEKDYPDLDGKTYIVTGSTTGVGLEAARLLAAKGATVYVHGRSQERARQAIDNIQKELPNAHLDSLIFDLADLASIKPGLLPFLEADAQLDGIILNAGVTSLPKGTLTKQGHTPELGVNNIGHQLVVRLLEKKLASPSRIVWVTSDVHGLGSPPSGVSWDTKANKPANIDSLSVSYLYGQSKAINIIQSYQWAQHHPHSHTISVSVHPGILSTDLARNLGAVSRKILSLIAYPAKYGAYTELYALLYPDTKVFGELKDGPIYISAFGVPRKDLLRPDVAETAMGELGKQVWDYLDEQTNKYL